MKKLSKLTALVLALAMAFALASCGGNSASTTGSASKSEAPAASASASGDKSAADASDAESDLQYVKDKGTLVVGITDFEACHPFWRRWWRRSSSASPAMAAHSRRSLRHSWVRPSAL